MRTPYKILLWDMDGTLMDSRRGLSAGIQYTLKQCGLPPETEETIRSFLGPSLKHTFQTHYGLPEETANEAVRIFRAWFAQNGMFEGNAPYPGILELLPLLKQSGYRMAIATSKLEKFAVQIADHFGLTPYFDFVCGSDEEGLRPEKPEVIAWALSHFEAVSPKEVLMIGDRRMDVDGARENGIDVLAVLYGYGTPEEAGKADFQVQTVAELQRFLLPEQ